MPDLETSSHLFQPPLYRAPDQTWHRDFAAAARRAGGELSWDRTAILSMPSFNYVCGDRTLVRGVRRRPWLAGAPELQHPRPRPAMDLGRTRRGA